MQEHSRRSGVVPPDAVGPFASSWRRRHLSVDERVARGLTARKDTPRSSHGPWQPAPDRPDPIALLEEQAASRVPWLVPIRYGRMLASPFTLLAGPVAYGLFRIRYRKRAAAPAARAAPGG